MRLVVRVLILAAVPCLLHALLVPLHAMGHDFSALKLGLAVALGPFCLLPAAIVQGARWRFGLPWLSLLYVVPVAAVLWHFSAVDRRAAFPRPWDALPELAAFFEEHVRWDDAVFSPDFVVPRHPPQLLAYTMKRVRRAHSLADVRAWAAAHPNHEGDFVIVSLRAEAADETAFPPMHEASEVAGVRWVRLEREVLGQELGGSRD